MNQKNNPFSLIPLGFGFLMTGIFFLLLLASLSACSTITTPTQNPTDPNTVYEYSLAVNVNGQTISGVGHVPTAKTYTMTITSSVDVDLLTIDSCHRSFSTQSAIDVNWIHPHRSYTYTYTPVIGIEDQGSCLLRIGTYNEAKGANAWAIIDFDTSEVSLPALNICNGTSENSLGVSVCQSKAGLIENLSFPSPVEQATASLDPKCKMTSADGKMWQYTMPEGECVILFHETVPPHRLHRHTTIGYDQVLIEE